MASQIPDLFGAPAPQDTGGALRGLMDTQARAAEMQAQSFAQAMGSITQSFQTAMQVRERKAEQLREIEANERLTRLGIEARADEARLARKQSEDQFNAGMALNTRKFEYEQGRDWINTKMQRADMAQDNKIARERLRLDRAQFRDSKETQGLQREELAQRLALGAQQQKDLDLRRQQEALFGEIFTKLVSKNPDGTYDTSGLERLPQLLAPFQTQTPYDVPTPGQQQHSAAANDPRTVPYIAERATAAVGAMSELPLKKGALEADMMKAQGSGGMPLLPASGPVYVTSDMLSGLRKDIPGSALSMDALEQAAANGAVVINPATGQINLIGQQPPHVWQAMGELQQVLNTRPTLAASLVGNAALPGAPASQQFDWARSNLGAMPGSGGAPAAAGGAPVSGGTPPPVQPTPAAPAPAAPAASAQPGTARSAYLQALGARSTAPPPPTPQPKAAPNEFLSVKDPRPRIEQERALRPKGGKFQGSGDTVPPGPNKSKPWQGQVEPPPKRTTGKLSKKPSAREEEKRRQEAEWEEQRRARMRFYENLGQQEPMTRSMFPPMWPGGR